ncbi:trypsin-like peptidase domain-containing protein [Nannocystaceae bacterium ST9]
MQAPYPSVLILLILASCNLPFDRHQQRTDDESSAASSSPASCKDFSERTSPMPGEPPSGPLITEPTGINYINVSLSLVGSDDSDTIITSSSKSIIQLGVIEQNNCIVRHPITDITQSPTVRDMTICTGYTWDRLMSSVSIGRCSGVVLDSKTFGRPNESELYIATATHCLTYLRGDKSRQMALIGYYGDGVASTLQSMASQLRAENRFVEVSIDRCEKNIALLRVPASIPSIGAPYADVPSSASNNGAFGLAHPLGGPLSITQVMDIECDQNGEICTAAFDSASGSSGGGIFDANGSLQGIILTAKGMRFNCPFEEPIPEPSCASECAYDDDACISRCPLIFGSEAPRCLYPCILPHAGIVGNPTVDFASASLISALIKNPKPNTDCED